MILISKQLINYETKNHSSNSSGSGCGSISCNGVTLREQSGFVDVKHGDVVNFMPSSPSGSFILTFSNEKTTDRYEVVMKEIEKTGTGYISWMHPLYEGI